MNRRTWIQGLVAAISWLLTWKKPKADTLTFTTRDSTYWMQNPVTGVFELKGALPGRILEVQHFDRALSPEEIHARELQFMRKYQILPPSESAT